MLSYRPSQVLTKWRSFSTTVWFKLLAFLELCVLHTQQACNWDDQNLVEVTQMFLQWAYHLHGFCTALELPCCLDNELVILNLSNWIHWTSQHTSKSIIVVVTKSMLFWIQRCYCELVTNDVYDNFQETLATGGAIQCSIGNTRNCLISPLKPIVRFW